MYMMRFGFFEVDLHLADSSYVMDSEIWSIFNLRYVAIL